MKDLNEINVKELNAEEQVAFRGGGAAELIGLGIVSGVLIGYAGLYGAAYAYYNYFKD